eukprot:GFYU01005262.1.p1 GENE.GFYU01005262.1~~GFYU01005262.1.p1  ORF type:complete len:182 (-),score=68.59 GFYU01005262.1:240-755(-)
MPFTGGGSAGGGKKGSNLVFTKQVPKFLQKFQQSNDYVDPEDVMNEKKRKIEELRDADADDDDNPDNAPTVVDPRGYGVSLKEIQEKELERLKEKKALMERLEQEELDRQEEASGRHVFKRKKPNAEKASTSTPSEGAGAGGGDDKKEKKKKKKKEKAKTILSFNEDEEEA